MHLNNMHLKMTACLTALATTASAFSRAALVARPRAATTAAAFPRRAVRRPPCLAPRRRGDDGIVRRSATTAQASPDAVPADGPAAHDAVDDVADDAADDAAARAALRSPFLRTMRDRGYLFQCTGLADLDELLCDAEADGTAVAAYLGFDATADSLHVGSLLQIMVLRHLQKAGHRPIVLIGGGTSKVGDPTGKDESRQLLDDAALRQNTEGISRVFRTFLSFDDATGAASALMVNNDDWLSSLKYLEFLRDYGRFFTINRMLSFESVKQRLAREAPLSFLEFNYMILQAYDFLELHRRYGVRLQLGGSDQWGNMVSGMELGRRAGAEQLYALTAPLVTTSDGKKMGKTAGGAVWLNADRLSAFDYWQFWRNTADGDVGRFLKLFTELPLDEIADMEAWEGARINDAKAILADEATALLHGRECLEGIRATAERMFGSGRGEGASTEGMTRVHVSADEAREGVKFIDLFVRLGLATSKKEARRLIQGGGAKLGDERITDENAVLNAGDFGEKGEVTLRAGKKRAGVVELE